jgi:uncharacterized protein YcbX
LKSTSGGVSLLSEVRSLEVCGISASGRLYDDHINKWFVKFMGIQCSLARRDDVTSDILAAPRASRETKRRHNDDGDDPKKKGIPDRKGNDTDAQRIAKWGFANEGQYLLVSQASVDMMATLSGRHHIRMRRADGVIDDDINTNATNTIHEYDRINADRFRPNFVIEGGIPFQEDGWSHVSIGHTRFHVSGPCARCTMVNIDQVTGSRESNLFATLASTRRRTVCVICLWTVMMCMTIWW